MAALEPQPMTIFGVREYVERKQRLCFVDARTREERLQSGIAIPKSISVPPNEIEDFLDDVPRDCPIVVYCVTPDQANSTNVAKALLAYGWRDVHPLSGGFDAWAKAGYEVELLDK